MGNTADKERDPSESSGLSDMMEIASSLGLDDDDVASAGVTRADDDEAGDDLENLGAGYGGAAAAALISDASLDPEPAPAANRPSESQVSRAAPPPPPAAKTRHPSGSTRAVEDAPVAAAAVSTSSAPKPSRAVSESQPVAATPKAASSLLGAPTPIVVPGAQPKQAEKKKGGFLLIAVGLVALLGIGWFIYDSQNQVKEHPIAANDVRAAASAPEEPPPPPPKPEPKKVEPPPPPPPVEEEPVVEEPPPPPPEEAKAEVTVTRKKKGSGKAGGDGDKPDPSAAAEKGPTQAEIDEKFRTECLLNPTKPGCDELRKKQRDAGDLDAKLVDKLTASQIREGFGKVKGKAKACGGETGTVVKVKVSINGSGEVTSVNALDEHAGTPLGNCVENALKDAKFPRFSSESQGAVYPVSF